MIEIFKFESQEIRFVGTPDDLWWVAADICAVLGISNVSQKLQGLDEEERSMFNIGRQGEAWCVNEFGLYSLILSSRKPEAKKFKKWVTNEVLPAIRKTGSYSVKEESTLSIQDAIALANLASASAINAGVDKEVSEQLKLEGLMQMYPDSKPLLKQQKDAIAASNPLPEKPLTPTEIGHMLATRLEVENVSAKKVNRKLLELGYQASITRIRRSNGKEVHDYYQATEKGKPHSTLLMATYTEGDGKGTKPQLRWYSSILPILINNWEAEQ